MSRKSIDVSKEFGAQVLRYLEHFGMTEFDLANLIGSNSNDIQEIILGSKSVVLKTAENISNVFNIRYFELGNPSFTIPDLQRLPEKTKTVIKDRARKGVTKIHRDYSIDISGHLDAIITSDYLHTPRTAEQIWKQLPEDIKSKIEPRRITDLLGKNPRNQIVEKVGKNGREFLFQLKNAKTHH